MYSYGRRHFLILELDCEAKNEEESIFGFSSSIFEEIR
jgi:hypothetical protein